MRNLIIAPTHTWKRKPVDQPVNENVYSDDTVHVPQQPPVLPKDDKHTKPKVSFDQKPIHIGNQHAMDRARDFFVAKEVTKDKNMVGLADTAEDNLRYIKGINKD